MKLYVGLGNPGPQYAYTRHNIGFCVIDTLLNELGLVNEQKEKFKGLYVKAKINGEDVLLLKPTTYMNNSGESVREIVDFYKINLEDIVIIHDDMDFKVGSMKLRSNGSAAGHNGIKSIIAHLSSQEFKRIRVGIGKPTGNDIDFVLGKFSQTEIEDVKNVTMKAVEALKDFTKMSFQDVMTKYNSKEKANEGDTKPSK